MTEHKFKTGDEVVILSCGYYPERIGEVGIVTGVYEGSLPYSVTFADRESIRYYERELRLTKIVMLGGLGD